MKFERGQSLFEVVIGLAISTLVMVAIVSLATLSIRNTNFSKNKVIASRYSQEATEWLRGQRDSDYISFYTHSLTPKWCLSSLMFVSPGDCSSTSYITDTTYYRDLTFSNSVTAEGKTVIEANIRVYWTDGQGYHEVVSATNFTDWRQR